MLRIMLFIFSLTSCLATGQDFRSRIEAMKKEYSAITQASIHMLIQVYESGTAVPMYHQEAIIKKQHMNYFYQFDQTEMLMNEKYIIVVDESARQILCTDRSLKDEKDFLDPFQANLDSVLKYFDEPTLMTGTETEDRYQLSPKSDEIKTIDLFISKSTNLVTRIDYQYTEGYKAQVFFKMFDRAPVFKESDFSEGKYIVKEKGAIRTTPLYSRFNLAVN